MFEVEVSSLGDVVFFYLGNTTTNLALLRPHGDTS
jgi:hypothetical protein